MIDDEDEFTVISKQMKKSGISIALELPEQESFEPEQIQEVIEELETLQDMLRLLIPMN